MSKTIEETGVAVRDAQSVVELMQALLDKNIDPVNIEKLVVIKERIEANNARKAYYAAMAAFKADPLEIEKDKHVKFTTQKGVTEYDHASLGNVTKQINCSLSKYGLSAAWELAQDGNKVTVTCRISHALGHSESTSLTAGLDDSGGKNVIQQLGSTISYLERYTIMALTGTASNDQDDDGKGSQVIELITEEQKSAIVDLLNSKGITAARWDNFLAKWEFESIDKIPAAKFKAVKAAIDATKGKV